ncbi:1,4-alpha-glucan branching protein [Streptomyces sp. NPDC057197]|uniref:maltokinase N-terminal cap-like domain-containing protein n=1 Tax=Streptomyces sp. NPDC057197 TaxID=3346045 RepID=UPI003630BEA5
MAVIHRTTLEPTKLELLTAWLPSRPWYGGAPRPELSNAGGFRLDDPSGEVGIEFLVVNDTSGPSPAAYLVPLTYRGAPLDGAGHALVGTMEHGVLGRRWAYDGCHDPVLAARLAALIEGTAQAQAQRVSDTPDHEIVRSYTGTAPAAAVFSTVTDTPEATELTAPEGTVLRLVRALSPAPDGAPVRPPTAAGHVAGPWRQPDGTRVRGLFAVLHTGADD